MNAGAHGRGRPDRGPRTKDRNAGRANAANIVPQGGLFWDGRADTLQIQASSAADPREMTAAASKSLRKLRHAPYAGKFVALFGENIFKNMNLLVAEATFAVGRYQVEEPSFYPYTSKYDYWLKERQALVRPKYGLSSIQRPEKANCAGCHTPSPCKDGFPPPFTDTQYEALAAPLNFALADTRDPNYFDLGVRGPIRKNVADQNAFCGMFKTPTLRTRRTPPRSSTMAYSGPCSR